MYKGYSLFEDNVTNDDDSMTQYLTLIPKFRMLCKKAARKNPDMGIWQNMKQFKQENQWQPLNYVYSFNGYEKANLNLYMKKTPI